MSHFLKDVCCLLLAEGRRYNLPCCWPLYSRVYVFLNPDGENRKGADPHFMEFLSNQFFYHWFLGVDLTSCKWWSQIKGNISVTVAFKMMLGVLAVFSDCVYVVCHLGLSPAEGLRESFIYSSVVLSQVCLANLMKGTTSPSASSLAPFLGNISDSWLLLKECTWASGQLFPGKVLQGYKSIPFPWDRSWPSQKEMEVEFTGNIFPVFWWKYPDITSLVPVEPAQPFPLILREYMLDLPSSGENNII